MKIQHLIFCLENVLRQEGDLEIVMSSDPEGNNFYTLERDYMFGKDDETNRLILYPTTPIHE